jgi:hypothetical protein
MGVTVPRNFDAQGIPVEPPQSVPVLQSASQAEQEAKEGTDGASSGLTFAILDLQITPPAMHIAPSYAYFSRNPALQAPLVWGAPPFDHTVDRQLPISKRARKVCSKCNYLECNAPYVYSALQICLHL